MLKDALSVDETLTLKLYKTNVTPAESDTAASFTVADFTNYVNKTLTRAGWGAFSTTGGVSSSVYAQQSWSPGSSQTIYGYYVIGTTSTVLLWAELFAAAKSLVSPDTFLLTPRMEAA